MQIKPGAVELRVLPVMEDVAKKTTEDVIAVVTINRPEVANAFNAAVIAELTGHFEAVRAYPRCRALILRGKGKHFSAGADLAWMQAAATLSYAENIADAQRLTMLFESLSSLPMPTIGVITGSAFGGAVGLTACCDLAIATENARFALSEVKLGLAPAVILPYLARKMRPGQLRRYALTGRVFSAAEALECGLVERIVQEDALDEAIRDELNALLAGSPAAQAALKQLHQHIIADSLKQGPRTAETIAGLRTSTAGQAGLQSFFDKTSAPWVHKLGANWRSE